jgi:hypothetical protein
MTTIAAATTTAISAALRPVICGISLKDLALGPSPTVGLGARGW